MADRPPNVAGQEPAGGTRPLVPGDAAAASAGTSLNASGRAVAKNAVSGYVTLGLSALLGFALTPILLHGLGAVGFGTWSLILGTATYLSLLELGLGLATTTRVAASEHEGAESLSRILSSSLALFCGLAGVGVLLSACLAVAFPLLFDVPAALRGSARFALVLVGAWQSVSLVVSVYSGCLLGTGRMYLVNFSGFAVSSLVSVLQASDILLGGGLRWLGAIQLLGGLATLAVFRRQVKRAFPNVAIGVRRAERPVVRRLLSLGWRNGVTWVSSTLAFGSDVVLVGLLLTPTAAAAYAIALRGYTLLHRLTTGALGALGPTQTHAATHASADRRFDLYCLSVGVTLLLALGAACSVGFYAAPLLELWLGDPPADASRVLTVLCAVLALQAPGFTAYSLLLNSERTGELMRITMLAAGCNVIASVILTATLGTLGPALGSLAAVTIFDAFYLPRRVCRLLGRSYLELGRRVLLPLIVPVGLLSGVLAVGRATVPRGVWILGVLAVATATFAAAAWRTPTVRHVWRIVRPRRAESA